MTVLEAQAKWNSRRYSSEGFVDLGRRALILL